MSSRLPTHVKGVVSAAGVKRNALQPTGRAAGDVIHGTPVDCVSTRVSVPVVCPVSMCERRYRSACLLVTLHFS